MHETLEMKEDEIAQLRSRLQQATTQKEELQEQKEKAEKSGEWCESLLPRHKEKKNHNIKSIPEITALFCFSPKAFEELERALGVAQKAEEARKQLQVQLEEQVREVERAGEEERKSLQQELSRVKQEVVSIMKVWKGPLLNVGLLHDSFFYFIFFFKSLRSSCKCCA